MEKSPDHLAWIAFAHTGAAGLPPVPALESLYRQAAASIRLAGDLGSGSAAMIDVKSMFSASPKAVSAASFRQA